MIFSIYFADLPLLALVIRNRWNKGNETYLFIFVSFFIIVPNLLCLFCVRAHVDVNMICTVLDPDQRREFVVNLVQIQVVYLLYAAVCIEVNQMNERRKHNQVMVISSKKVANCIS